MKTLKDGNEETSEDENTEENETSNENGFFTPNEKIDFSNVKIEPMFEEVDFDTFFKSDFRAVKVKACEAVKKSKKLLQFTLDDGTGTDWIILSGIHAYYEPEELVGNTLIAITNIPLRKMRVEVTSSNIPARSSTWCCPFFMLLLKPKSIKSGIKRMSLLLYNSVRRRGLMAHQVCNQEMSYHYG
jgi:methionine--tRNA ligase beta chain